MSFPSIPQNIETVPSQSLSYILPALSWQKILKKAESVEPTIPKHKQSRGIGAQVNPENKTSQAGMDKGSLTQSTSIFKIQNSAR